MRIAVMGAGALGGYFGGRLAAAGHDVTLIARGAHLAAIRENGLQILSPNGDLHLRDIAATDDPGAVGPVDGILFFVKNYDVIDAARAIKPMLGPGTWVATFQNGITAPYVVAEEIGRERVLGGVAKIPAQVDAPGVIRHTDRLDILEFGELENRQSDRVEALHKALTEAGVTPQISANIEAALWGKFVLLSATSAITCLTRLNFGQILSTERSANLLRGAMAETAALARAVLPDFPEGAVDAAFRIVSNMDGRVRSSMMSDLMAGRRLELDWISGEIVRQGKEHGIPTPIHEIAVAALWPYRNGAPD